MKRGPGPKRKAPLARASATLRASTGLKRANLHPGRSRREKTPEAWKAGVPCGYHGHHVVYRERVVQEGGDIWDLRNRMVLDECRHFDHHHGTRRLYVHELPDSAFEFAAELLGGVGAFAYLNRRYLGDDARLFALLQSPRDRRLTDDHRSEGPDPCAG